MDEKNLCYRDGDHMVCVCSSGDKFLYDFEDHDLIKAHRWCFSNRQVRTSVCGKTRVLSHMLIPNSKFRIYHRNKDNLDFRRVNLCFGNKYYFYDTYVVGECINGALFVIDIDDYKRVSQYVWFIDNQGYVISFVKGKTILQHRLIMRVLSNKQEIDHVNFDTSDNRKSNLRIATRSQNRIHKRDKRNKSGVVGVFWRKNIQKWTAEITSNGHRRCLGYFKTFEEAVQARLKAEQELHGEFRINLSTISNQAANSGRLNDQEGQVPTAVCPASAGEDIV